jgi:hypothetical protein
MEDSSSDAKRRRYNGYNPNTPTDITRPMAGEIHGPIAFPYPSPRGFDARRGSLRPSPGASYHASHASRGSNGGVSNSPAAGILRSSISAMGPPPGRAFPTARNELNAYPPTPLTVQSPHVVPSSGRVRQNSESLRLPPLLSPGTSDQSRSVEAMVMSMPYLAKIKLLRRIATPLKAPSPASPSLHVRGSIITVESDDKDSIGGVLRHLAELLRRSGEFDVRVVAGPNLPNGKVGLREFLLEVASWHRKTTEMINFITGVKVDESEQNTVKSTAISRKDSEDVDKMEVDNGAEESDLEEGEIIEEHRKQARDNRRSLRAREIERKREQIKQQRDREAEKLRKSEQLEKERKIPLILISNYILHASDAWASAIPINDAYSPSDHWQWIATLWRGIVGADITVYVKSVDKEEPPSASSVENWVSTKPTIDIREDIGVLVVKKEKEGKAEDGAIRRVAFEVGEWVRAGAAHASTAT